MNYLVIKSWARLLECDAEVMPNTEVKIVESRHRRDGRIR
jgi:hypothetical protein